MEFELEERPRELSADLSRRRPRKRRLAMPAWRDRALRIPEQEDG